MARAVLGLRTLSHAPPAAYPRFLQLSRFSTPHCSPVCPSWCWHRKPQKGKGMRALCKDGAVKKIINPSTTICCKTPELLVLTGPSWLVATPAVISQSQANPSYPQAARSPAGRLRCPPPPRSPPWKGEPGVPPPPARPAAHRQLHIPCCTSRPTPLIPVAIIAQPQACAACSPVCPGWSPPAC